MWIIYDSIGKQIDSENIVISSKIKQIKYSYCEIYNRELEYHISFSNELFIRFNWPVIYKKQQQSICSHIYYYHLWWEKKNMNKPLQQLL